MSRFQKTKPTRGGSALGRKKLGYRTSDFFKRRLKFRKQQPPPQKIRYTQHKG